MFSIVTDSCSDLSKAYIQAQQAFHVVPLMVRFGEEMFYDGPNSTIDGKTLYDRLRAGEVATTSQANVNDLYDLFLPLAKAGEEVLCPVFSSALSGTCSAFLLAAKMVAEEVPGAKIRVVDTLAASTGQGLLVRYALEKRDGGMSLEEVADWLEQNKLRMSHWLTVDDLNFLKRGGRCSPAAAFFGTMMSIKPILHMDNEGKLIAREKVRGRKNAMRALVDQMEKTIVNPKDQIIGLNHGDCEEEALALRDQIVERLGVSKDKIVMNYVGPVIGAHTGPNILVVFFMATDRG